MVKPLKIPARDDETVLPDTSLPPSNQYLPVDQVLFFAGLMAEKAEAKKAANKAYAAVRKQFDNAGATLYIADLAKRIAEADDPAAVDKFLGEFLHYIRAFTALPMNAQADFFAGPGNAVDVKEKAHKMGYMLGVMGKNPDEQAYQPNTDLGQEHLKGWNAGQEVRQREFLAHNERARQEAAAQEAKKAADAKRKEERAAKLAEKEGRKVPVNTDGETVQ